MSDALNYEKVWVMFQDLKEQMKETDLRMKETALQMKETDRRIGELGNRFGELAEHLVAPSIRQKFNALGFTFDTISQNIEIDDALDPCTGAEIDILLENGDTAIAVEVKAKANYKDVDRHIERMAVLRRRADRKNDKRNYLGGIASAIMPKEIRNYIHKAGFYAIEKTGDTVRIDAPQGWTPRAW